MILQLLLNLSFLCSALAVSCHEPKYPVVIIPGIAASVLDAKIHRRDAAEWYCTKHSDWRIVFLSFREALSPTCLCDELLVHTIAGEHSNTYSNQQGVHIRPHDFGGLAGIAALDPSSEKLTATYRPLITALESVGYRERETLWGAPYDWRLAGDGLAATGADGDIQSLIEMAVRSAGGQPAVIIAHSMGNLVLTYFMRRWGADWVRRHIHHVVAASAPFGGAVGSVKAPVSGDNLSLHFPHNLLHALQGVAPSGVWLFPSPELWPEDEVIVRTNKKHYSAHDLERLLMDVGLGELSGGFPNIRALHAGMLESGTVPVPLTCAYGTGLDTDSGYVYPVDNLDAVSAPEPTAVSTKDGDGTVNLRSLRVCSGIGLGEDSTATVEVEGAAHLDVLTTKPFFRALAKILELCFIPAEAAAGLRGGGGLRVADAGARREADGRPAGPGANDDEGGGVVGRMHEAAAGVLAAGCAERRRLEGVRGSAGELEWWEEAALHWHRQWRDCSGVGEGS